MSDFIATYVSQKLSAVRWQPTDSNLVSDKPEIFCSGSWDDQTNQVSLWSTQGNVDEDFLPGIIEEPSLLSSCMHSGHVTDLKFNGPDTVVGASSLGNITLYKVKSKNLKKVKTWEKLHHYKPTTGCACTSIATKGEDTVVTVGEDGRIHILNIMQKNPVTVIENADSCTMNAVMFLKHLEIATVNSTGQLKLWDLRGNQKPTRTFSMAGDCIGLQCLDKHPTQQHIVATGGQDGTLCIWDMRQDRFPVTLLSAHSAQMWDIKFHESQPDNLFTCSEDGSVWHWDGSSINTGSTDRFSSSWLASDATKHRLEITDVLPGNTMPVNTLDVQATTLICATDGEQLYAINNLAIK